MVLGQLDREATADQSAEGAAGLELGQLAMIADEHELAARPRRPSRPARRAGGSASMPASSTTSTHRSGSALGLSRAERAEQRGDARARDPGAILELPSGTPRDRDAEHRDGQPPATPRARRRARTSCPSRPCRRPQPRRHRQGRAARPSRAARPRASAAPRPPRSPRARARDAGVRAARLDRAVDQPLLERQQLRRRVRRARSPANGSTRPSRRRNASPASRSGNSATTRGEARKRSAAASSARASTTAPAGSSSHSACMTSRRENVDARRRQPGRRRQLIEHPLPRRRVELDRADPAQQPLEVAAVEPELGRARPPSRDQLSGADAVALRSPRRQRRRLGRARARRPTLVERRLDLRPPATERPQHRLRDARQLGDPLADRQPLEPEASASARTAAPPGRRSSPPARARTAADHRAPTTAHPDRARGSRRGHACAAADRRRATSDDGTPPRPDHQPARRAHRHAPGAPRPPSARDTRPPPATARSWASTNRGPQLAVTDAEEHAHALRRRERQIEPRHPHRARCASQRQRVLRVQPGEHAAQRVAVYLT